jgi:hypothetical protein
MLCYLSDGICRRELGLGHGIRGDGGSGATPPGAGDDDDLGDGQDNHAIEPAHTSGNTGSSRGGGFAAHGSGGRGQGGGRFGRGQGDNSGARVRRSPFSPSMVKVARCPS